MKLALHHLGNPLAEAALPLVGKGHPYEADGLVLWRMGASWCFHAWDRLALDGVSSFNGWLVNLLMTPGSSIVVIVIFLLYIPATILWMDKKSGTAWSEL